MRVPTRSEGTRSGVNWIRANVPPSTPAVVLIVSVFASPGTPSMRRWPCARRQTRTRSSIASCPAMTRLISKSACSRRSLASVGEGTAASLVSSVTSAPSLVGTESYTTARKPKFLLREYGAGLDRSSRNRIALDHDQIPGRAPVSRGRGADARDRAQVEAGDQRAVPADFLGAQPRRHRRRGDGKDVLRLRGAGRRSRQAPRDGARSARRRRDLRDRRRRHARRLPARLKPGTVPSASQARAGRVNGPSGREARTVSRRLALPASSSEAQKAPVAGPAAPVNGSQ